MSARRIGCESRNNDSNVQYGYVCRLSALSVSRRLEACKHRIHTLHGTRAHRTREAAPRTRTAGPARSAAEYTGQVPPEEGGAHHTPRVPPREGRGSLLGGSGLEQPLHASAHYGAPITELARHLHASAHHGARRPLRTCAPCRARRAPRAAGTGVAASPRRDHTCREHLMRGTQMHSDALRCTQMHSDALRCNQDQTCREHLMRGNQMQSEAIGCNQRQSRSHVPRAPDERQSEAIRSHQRQSEAIRSHQCQSEAIQSAERAVDVKRSDGAVSS